MKIIRRGEWGARPARSQSRNVRDGRVKLHWTVTCVKSNASLEAEKQHMRMLQNFHMDTNGWSDIAYNFVVMPSGRIFEGRGLGVRSAANGGLVTNTDHQAVAFVSAPTCSETPQQYEAVAELINTYYPKDVQGHRDGSSTTCPGDGIYRWIQDSGWKNALTEKGPSYWTWKAWRCSLGPWEGRGRKEKGATYRPRIPRRGSPKWPVWWAKFIRSGGCK